MRFDKVIFALARIVIKPLSVKSFTKFQMKYLANRGVVFSGKPNFIADDAYFDTINGAEIVIGNDVVISKEVMILTHDYSIARGIQSIRGKNWSGKNTPHFVRSVSIGDNCFIGARTFLLPGTKIGNNCIIGGGSVVRGVIPDNSIAYGNPCVVHAKTDEWARKCIEKGYV